MKCTRKKRCNFAKVKETPATKPCLLVDRGRAGTPLTMDLSADETHSSEMYGTLDASRVKRRLFEDEDGLGEKESTTKSQNLDSSSVGEGTLEVWNAKTEIGSYTESGEPKENVRVLLVTKNEESPLGQLIDERLQMLFTSASVDQCSPTTILRHGYQTAYTLVLLDMNSESDDLFFRTAEAIRHSGAYNRLTALVGLKFNSLMKCDGFRKYGINDMVYGPLYHGVIDQILTTWIICKGKANATQDTPRGNSISTAHTPEQGEVNCNGAFKSVPQSGDSNYARCHNATETRLLYISDSSETVQSSSSGVHSSTLSRPPSQKLGNLNKVMASCLPGSKAYSSSRHGLSSDSNDQPGSESTSSEVGSNQTSTPWTNSQQTAPSYPPYSKSGGLGVSIPAYVSKDTTEMSINSSTPGNCTAYPTPPPSLGSTSCRFPFIAPATYSAIAPHQNCTYVINGTPGTAGMRITYIPDELNKHSTKERERRERIKESCNQLRAILPRQAVNGRKADMATVLEMTVFYLRIIQTQVPPHIQQQASQLFCSFQSKCKRKRGDSVDINEPAPKTRLLDPPYYSSLSYPGEPPPPPPPPSNSSFLYGGPTPVACNSLSMPSAFSHLPGPPQGPVSGLSYLSQYGYPSALHGRPSPYLSSHQPVHPKPFSSDHQGPPGGTQGMNLYVDVCHNTSKDPGLPTQSGQESLATSEPF